LIKHEADPNIKNKKGETPLMMAILNYSIVKERRYSSSNTRRNVVQVLLDRGASVDLYSSDGTTPLHYAIKKQSEYLLGLLITRGADVNLKVPGGNSPLHEAASSENLVIAHMLPQNGANVDALNSQHATAMHITLAKCIDLLDKLRNPHRDIRPAQRLNLTSLVSGVTQNISKAGDMINLLLSFGIDISIQDSNGNTPREFLKLGREAFFNVAKESDEDPHRGLGPLIELPLVLIATALQNAENGIRPEKDKVTHQDHADGQPRLADQGSDTLKYPVAEVASFQPYTQPAIPMPPYDQSYYQPQKPYSYGPTFPSAPADDRPISHSTTVHSPPSLQYRQQAYYPYAPSEGVPDYYPPPPAQPPSMIPTYQKPIHSPARPYKPQSMEDHPQPIHSRIKHYRPQSLGDAPQPKHSRPKHYRPQSLGGRPQTLHSTARQRPQPQEYYQRTGLPLQDKPTRTRMGNERFSDIYEDFNEMDDARLSNMYADFDVTNNELDTTGTRRC
jgi:ankyrin repeat protein